MKIYFVNRVFDGAFGSVDFGNLVFLQLIRTIGENYFTSSDPHHDIYTFVTDISSGILSDISSDNLLWLELA